MPSPDGYRKALRLMKQAETLQTGDLLCGYARCVLRRWRLRSEDRGEAIARNLFEMAAPDRPGTLYRDRGRRKRRCTGWQWPTRYGCWRTPSIPFFPGGFASILWKDSKKAPDAAKVMKITAADLYERGLIEHVIPEQEPATIETMPVLAEYMRQSMTAFFERYSEKTKGRNTGSRYQRFRNNVMMSGKALRNPGIYIVEKPSFRRNGVGISLHPWQAQWRKPVVSASFPLRRSV